MHAMLYPSPPPLKKKKKNNQPTNQKPHKGFLKPLVVLSLTWMVNKINDDLINQLELSYQSCSNQPMMVIAT